MSFNVLKVANGLNLWAQTVNPCRKLPDCYFAKVYGRDVSVTDHKDRKIEQGKLPFIEVHHEGHFYGAGFVGFHSRRPRNSSSSRCISSCKEWFSPSIWLKLICSLHWTLKRIFKFTHLNLCQSRIVCLNHAVQQ